MRGEVPTSLKDAIEEMTRLAKQVREVGYKNGYNQGYKEGCEKGRKEGALVLVRVLSEHGCSKDTIICKLCEKYNLTTEEAKGYL